MKQKVIVENAMISVKRISKNEFKLTSADIPLGYHTDMVCMKVGDSVHIHLPAIILEKDLCPERRCSDRRDEL